MKTERYLEEDEMIKKAIDVLIKEIGPIETTRFLNMPREKRIESVKRHRQWQRQLDKEKFFDEVFGE